MWEQAITVSGISTGDFFTTFNTGIGSGTIESVQVMDQQLLVLQLFSLTMSGWFRIIKHLLLR